MKIYTKTGDYGTTSLYSGKRVRKDHPWPCVEGILDEFNSLLGIILDNRVKEKKILTVLSEVQNDIFLIGSSISGYPANLSVLAKRVKEMEEMIDELDKKLPKLTHFILPKGKETACFLFYARAVARRIEREIVALSERENVDRKIVIYFNRLSDLLFMMGRYLNFKNRIKEEIWKNQ